MRAAAFAITTILQLAAVATASDETTHFLHKRSSSSSSVSSQPRRRRTSDIEKKKRKGRQLQDTSSTAAESTSCSFCPSGLPDPTLVLPVEDGTTCLQAQEYAATLTVDDGSCATVKLAEAMCCPLTIYDLGAANEDFSTLVSFVDAAGLSDVFKGEGNFTLFGT